MLTIHLRINDAATGKPTPVRLRISGPGGTTYAPLGRFAEFPTGRNEEVGGHLKLGREVWCYTDGSCEVPLPAGVPLRVQATKGPEYRPLDETVTLGPGQMALRFTVERWINSAAKGWVSGDSRCHFLPPHAALLEAAAEDLAVVNLLACVQPVPCMDGTAYPAAPHLTAFSGQAPALEADGRCVAVNTLNVHPVLGKVGLLHSHRPVFPLAFGGDEPDDWSVCDWCDQCHRKGGLAVWVDAFKPAGGVVGGEALVAAILGKIDAIELTPLTPVPWVYRLWNAGFPVPLAGGSGKDRNTVPLGAVRTYALLHDGHTPSYKSWVEAVRAGRTFVTAGPLLTFDRDGTQFRAAAARRVAPFDRLEIVADGRVVAVAGNRTDTEIELDVGNAGWVTARCHSPGGAGFAHTSPVVFGPSPGRADAVAAIRTLVEQTREWVETAGRFANPRRKQTLLDRCDEALAKLGGPA